MSSFFRRGAHAPRTAARSAGGDVEVCPHDVLFEATSRGPVWRVLKGCLRLDRPLGAQSQLIHLALPGDWLGLEVVSGGSYLLQARALTPCLVESIEIDADDHRIWPRAWVQQQQQHVLMTQLRTGKVTARVERLLDLLDLGDHPSHVGPPPLPPLRDMAEVVDATVETVCRILSKRSAHHRTTPVSQAAFLSQHIPTVWGYAGLGQLSPLPG